jgi:hypothetical protein
MAKIKAWDAPHRGPKPKRAKIDLVKDLKEPNLGAGHIVPLIKNLLEELDELLHDFDPHLNPLLKFCRPLALHVYHAVKER